MLPGAACPRELKRSVVGRTRRESTGRSPAGPTEAAASLSPDGERTPVYGEETDAEQAAFAAESNLIRIFSRLAMASERAIAM